MATIRVSCRSCPASALLTPEQILLVHLRGWGSYLFVCPECGRVTDAPAGPDHMLLRRPPPASHSGRRPGPVSLVVLFAPQSATPPTLPRT